MLRRTHLSGTNSFNGDGSLPPRDTDEGGHQQDKPLAISTKSKLNEAQGVTDSLKQTIQPVKENLHLSAGDAEKRVVLKALEKLYETLDKQLAETYWSETTGAGTATTATRLVFRSRISKLTQLRAQSATNRRPKARFRW
ncbi:hypothetical protein F2Q70_00022864 [Brassica cretica]|uniref:Uncharacterized protein n=1 Tax=Brassica cretica TaxID=69181 RepID=A0A8S9GS72_BRACR|nr:hypothetical protein F2Q70_00022864 [Brassica cretica]